LIDLILVPPVVDRLRRDPELLGDLCDGLAGLDQIERLAPELDRLPPWHDDLLINARDSTIPIAQIPGQTTADLRLRATSHRLRRHPARLQSGRARAHACVGVVSNV
jgi:hypothetical protein